MAAVTPHQSPAAYEPQGIRLSGRWQLWLPLMIIAVTLGVYANSFGGAFLFDDNQRILTDETVRSLWPIGPHFHNGQRPVVTISLALNHAVGGFNVWGYHAFNVAVHILAALTLYGVIRRTLLNERFRGRWGMAAPWLAFSVALIWAVHPLQAQAVTYISQRAESLMGLFYLLTLYCVIRGSSSTRAACQNAWYLLAIMACALGMGSKAVMVTAPVMVIIYDRAFLSSSFRELVRRRWGLYLGLVSTWGILVALGVVGGILDTSSQPGTTVGFAYRGISAGQYAATQPWAITQYLRLAFWPDQLCLDYGWPVARTAREIGLPLVALAALAFGVIGTARHYPWIGFAGAWFLVILAPTSSFIPIRDTIFEHRMYLSLAAVILIAVGVIHYLLNFLFTRASLPSWLKPGTTGLLLIAVTIALGTATVKRNQDYHDPFVMWQDVLAKRPHNPRAHDSLGTLWDARGDYDKALAAFRQAVNIRPEYANARYNLGSLLIKRGYFDAGIAEYRETLRVEPNHPYAGISLGDALARSGRIDEGIAVLRDVLVADPENPRAHYFVANALSARGEFEEAITAYREALRLAPSYAGAHYSLANALSKTGRLTDAIQEFQESLRIAPDNPSAYNNLGRAWQRLGEFTKAEEAYRQALRINPTHANAEFNLANILVQRGRIDEATQIYETIIESKSRHALGAQQALQTLTQRQNRSGAP